MVELRSQIKFGIIRAIQIDRYIYISDRILGLSTTGRLNNCFLLDLLFKSKFSVGTFSCSWCFGGEITLLTEWVHNYFFWFS